MRPLYRERVKDEVYIATGVSNSFIQNPEHFVPYYSLQKQHFERNGDDGDDYVHDGENDDNDDVNAFQVGGGLLLLVIVVSLGLVSRYRRKFLEGKARFVMFIIKCCEKK